MQDDALEQYLQAHPIGHLPSETLVEAFPWDEPPRYLLRDRDSIYGEGFQTRVSHLGTEEVKMAPRGPWQSPYVERLIEPQFQSLPVFGTDTIQYTPRQDHQTH